MIIIKHPNLRAVGAHLGSLEWSVDELAKRLDKFPMFAVDMSARICHFQVQDHAKVRDFILKYQVDLDENVLKKIYTENALKLYPGCF